MCYRHRGHCQGHTAATSWSATTALSARGNPQHLREQDTGETRPLKQGRDLRAGARPSGWAIWLGNAGVRDSQAAAAFAAQGCKEAADRLCGDKLCICANKNGRQPPCSCSRKINPHTNKPLFKILRHFFSLPIQASLSRQRPDQVACPLKVYLSAA